MFAQLLTGIKSKKGNTTTVPPKNFPTHNTMPGILD